MNTYPLKHGVLIHNSIVIGMVTRKMVRERAVELAIVNGRSAQEVSKSDWEQAKQELAGDSTPNPEEAALESAAESRRWDLVPDRTGQKIPVAAREGGDEPGRSDHERLGEDRVSGLVQPQSRCTG